MGDTGGDGSVGHGLPNAGRTKQIVCSIMLTVSTLYSGANGGWMSPMTTKLRSDDSPVGPTSRDDIAMLASIPNYLGMISGIALAVIMNELGRKYALLILGAVGVSGGLFLSFANSNILLLIGRGLTGISGGTIAVAPMIISESVHLSLRGMMMALCSFQINTGILLAYIFGKILSYRLFNLILTVLPVIIVMFGLWIPETPFFLVSKGRTNDAMKSLVWWRGGSRQVAGQELEIIEPPSQEKISFTKAFKSRQSKMAFIVTIGGFLFQSFSGIHAIINYNSLIFEDIGNNGPFSPDDSSIIIAILITLATLANSALIDLAGRRPLLIFSFLTSSISMGVLTIFIFVLKSGADVANLTWIPLVSIGSFAVSYGLGVAVVPSVLMNELCPTDTKPTLAACANIVAFGSVITVLQSFVFIEEHFGLYVCFLIPTVMNLIGTVFAWAIVPETKGKSLTQISNELNRIIDISSTE